MNATLGTLIKKVDELINKVSSANLGQNIFQMPRYAPAFFSFFCGLALLIFRSGLNLDVINFLIPSLFIYTLGSALIGTFHRLLGMHYFKPFIIVKSKDGDLIKIVEMDIEKVKKEKKTKRSLIVYSEVKIEGNALFEPVGLTNNEKPIPIWWKRFIWLLHFSWFAILIIYNFRNFSLSW